VTESNTVDQVNFASLVGQFTSLHEELIVC